MTVSAAGVVGYLWRRLDVSGGDDGLTAGVVGCLCAGST